MNNEIFLNIGNKKYRLFLQPGFYSDVPPTDRIHKHNYAEIHIVIDGTTLFAIGDERYEASKSTMLVIPAGVYHSALSNRNTVHTAFQIDADINAFAHYKLEDSLLSAFCDELKRCAEGGDHTGISAYIMILCRFFLREAITEVRKIGDYSFLISEFFSNNYARDVYLCDLAQQLHLSNRQTERLVIEYTGNTFREELTATRVNMAKYLLKHTDMSLGEISSYVGYRSYAGFWKAMKKHGI